MGKFTRILLCVSLCFFSPLPLFAQIPYRGLQNHDVVNRPPQRLRFTFAGDLMAHTPNWSMANFDRIYERIKHVLLNDDFSFINIETPIDNTKPYYTYPAFNVHSPYIWAAIEAGFDVFSIANNHTYDKGSTGVRQSLVSLKELSNKSREALGRGIVYSGVREDLSDRTSLPILKKFAKGDISIGFVAMTEFINQWRDDGSVYLFDYKEEGVATQLLNWIKTKDEEVDILIVSYHAGVEYSQRPTRIFRDFCEDMVAAGVDIVWAHHPHVLQPWYLLPGPDGLKRLVMPSMGNFVSGQVWGLSPSDYNIPRAWTGDSALMGIEVTIKQEGPEITLVKPFLISHYRDPRGGVTVWPYKDLLQYSSMAWREFYKKRFLALADFFPESKGATSEWPRWSPFRN